LPEKAPIDAELGEVVAAWPTLCDVVRRQVLSIVRNVRSE
jgi:hypothetical protein